MPPEREPCETYGVSRITVRKALDDLQNEGYPTGCRARGPLCGARRWKGSFQFDSFGDELRRRGMNEVAKLFVLFGADAGGGSAP